MNQESLSRFSHYFFFPLTAVYAQSGGDADEYQAEVGAFYTGIHLKGFGETASASVTDSNNSR